MEKYPSLKRRLIAGGYLEDTSVVIVKEALRKGQDVVHMTIGEMDKLECFFMDVIGIGGMCVC